MDKIVEQFYNDLNLPISKILNSRMRQHYNFSDERILEALCIVYEEIAEQGKGYNPRQMMRKVWEYAKGSNAQGYTSKWRAQVSDLENQLYNKSWRGKKERFLRWLLCRSE